MSDLIAEIEFEAVNSEIDRHLAGRIIAALRALPAVQPKVKPLVWIEDGDGFCAKGANRTYAVFRLALDSSTWAAVGVKHTSRDKASVMAACQSDHDAQILAAMYPAVQPDAAAIREAALIKALENIRELNMTGEDEHGHRWAHSDLIEQEIVFAMIDTGKEVMPGERPVRVRQTDIGPGDQAVAGAAPWPEDLFGLTGDTLHLNCATKGCGQRVSTRFAGRDYCEPCGRKVALAQKGDSHE